MNNHVRVRFAPSPTGLMHIGNIRTSLLNYLFARHNQGTFIIRIEDTDQQRNFDPQAVHIIEHLTWLGLLFDEGPGKEVEKYAPYFQSQRNDVYEKARNQLIELNAIYRCFCTHEELETKRNRQIAMKKPPRYDQTCRNLSAEAVAKNLELKKPYIWRMKIDNEKTIQFHDMSHGNLEFHLKNFTDFPISREDGTFTFMFANCIDDITMDITHILRGEDHLTNTVGQATIFLALQKKLPTFWHLPILCNTTGKKLSKRDQGFSLEDLRQEGFLPQAICNYLGIIGGSFEQEIMSLEELTQTYNFEHISPASQIKYDIEKLKWVNHKWISRISDVELTTLCKPFLQKQYDISNIKDAHLTAVLAAVKTDLVTLADCTTALEFLFKRPHVSQEQLTEIAEAHADELDVILLRQCDKAKTFEQFFEGIKEEASTHAIPHKKLFMYVRLLLTGNAKGLGIHVLADCLGFEEIKHRICKK